MVGAIRFTNSSHLLAIEGWKFVKPVRLPPGRAKLWTTPAVTFPAIREGHVKRSHEQRHVGTYSSGPRGNRPRSRAAEQRDEVAPSHSSRLRFRPVCEC